MDYFRLADYPEVVLYSEHKGVKFRMPVVITLIHGTWAQNAAWIRAGSPLRKACEEVLGDLVAFRVFHWSGNNSFAARTSAGEELRAFLNEGLQMFPKASHSIISHSHGGNILLYALDDPALRHCIHSSVCLSTPFITVAERNFGEFMGFTLTALHWGFALLAACVVIWNISFLSALATRTVLSDHSGFFHDLPFLIVFALIVLPFWAAIYFPARVWKDFAVSFRTRHTLKTVDDLNILVIRSAADEASGALTTTQFFAWALTRIWQAMASVPAFLRSVTTGWGEWAGNNQLLALLISFLLACSMALLLLLVHDKEVFHNWWGATFYILGVTVGGRLLGVRWAAGLLLAVCTLIVGLLSFPLIILLSVIMMPFSPLDSFLFGPLQITVEAAPVGVCQIVQLPSTKGSGLMHSSTYENPLALRAVVKWIMARPEYTSLGVNERDEWSDAKNEANRQTLVEESSLEKRRRIGLRWRYAKALVVIAILAVAGRYVWVKGLLRTVIHPENITYVPTQDLRTAPGMPVNIVVTRTALKKEDKLHVTLQIPANSDTSNRTYTHILVYGYKVLAGKRTDDIPNGTFQERNGSWHAGDRIALDINVPKQFSNGSAGRVLRIGVADGTHYDPSPNLLAGDALK